MLLLQTALVFCLSSLFPFSTAADSLPFLQQTGSRSKVRPRLRLQPALRQPASCSRNAVTRCRTGYCMDPSRVLRWTESLGGGSGVQCLGLLSSRAATSGESLTMNRQVNLPHWHRRPCSYLCRVPQPVCEAGERMSSAAHQWRRC